MATVIFIFDPKVKSKDKSKFAKIIFFSNTNTALIQFRLRSSMMLIFWDDDVCILCKSLGHVVTGIKGSWIRKLEILLSLGSVVTWAPVVS